MCPKEVGHNFRGSVHFSRRFLMILFCEDFYFFAFSNIFLWRVLKLGVVKAACSPPSLPFLDQRFCFARNFSFCSRFVTCPRTLSLRWNVVTEAICLQVALVFGLLRYARNDKKNKMTARHKCRSR